MVTYMVSPKESQSGVVPSPSLPRRDLWLLPLLSLATVLVLLLGSEILSRLIWTEQVEDSCKVVVPGVGTRFRPNCVSKTKVPEGPWIRNAYNACGYRTAASCGAKQPGEVRVAVLGTSYSYGYMTPYEDAYTSLAGTALSKACRRPVDFQNLGVPNLNLVGVYRRLPEALALEPSLVLLSVSPLDFREVISPEALASRNVDHLATDEVLSRKSPNWLKWTIVEPLKQSRTMYMLQHYAFQDTETYLNLYLLYGDKVGYLNKDFSPIWKARFANFDVLLADMVAKTKQAGVPLVVLAGPVASQIALDNDEPRAGMSADAFPNEIRRIAGKYGVPVIDPLPAMSNQPHPMQMLYVVDGHVAAKGQSFLAASLQAALRSDASGPFAHCSQK